jgi:hypothetical protein
MDAGRKAFRPALFLWESGRKKSRMDENEPESTKSSLFIKKELCYIHCVCVLILVTAEGGAP